MTPTQDRDLIERLERVLTQHAERDAIPKRLDEILTDHTTQRHLARRRAGQIRLTDTTPRSRTLQRTATAAAAIALVVTGLVVVVRRGDSAVVVAPAASIAGPDISPWRPTRTAEVTWYVPEGPSEPSPWHLQSLVCRSVDDQGRCTALAGTRTVIYRTTPGQISVSTEYGPYESALWQMLRSTGRPVDLGDRVVLTIPGNDELVGFQVSPDVRVVVGGESGTDTIGQVSGLTTHTETLELPVVFGEALATPQPRSRDEAGVAYYAGYLDATGEQTCVGSIGASPDSTPSCVAVETDTLTIAVDSPTTNGTILIATVPTRTVRAVATDEDGTETDLAITDASQHGYKVTFADLDASDPHQLIAYGDDGIEIARTEFAPRPEWVRATNG